MKKIAAFLTYTILSCQLILSQDFEGHITFKVSSSLDAKAQQASQELNKPENKEKLKQLEEQMKSPEFQKMLEQNPQLKAQMEAALKIQSGGGIESLTPKSVTIYVKNGNSLTKTEGGASTHQSLHLKEKNINYQIFPERKTYYVLPNNSAKDNSKQLQAVKTSETKQILGYTCTKYTVQDKTTTMAFWTTTEIKGIDYEQLRRQYQQSGGQGIQGLQGVTLKMEFKTPQANMDMEAVELKKETLAASLFTIPAGFTEEKMPYAKPNAIGK